MAKSWKDDTQLEGEGLEAVLRLEKLQAEVHLSTQKASDSNVLKGLGHEIEFKYFDTSRYFNWV